MISKKQLMVETDGLLSLKGLVEVYEEVAAGRMQKVRGAVLQSRQFLEGLLVIFAKIKSAYINDSNKQMTTRVKNNRTAAVFISANSRLYGDIVDRTFNSFVDYTKTNKPDVVVLGKLGLSLMADRLPGVLFNYFDFSDDKVEMESFEIIMRYLLQFEKILVFYGQFKTILSQEPVITSVSGDAISAVNQQNSDSSGKKIVKQYIFEPSLEVISKVFEGEILASVFEQTLHESQLSKYASRMLALDRSIDNIEKRLLEVRSEGVRLKHKSFNKKQLSTFSGVSLWTNG
jgi:ATP synthase F1 gamma subunit